MPDRLHAAVAAMDKAMTEAQRKRDETDGSDVEPSHVFYDGMAEGLAKAMLICKDLIPPDVICPRCDKKTPGDKLIVGVPSVGEDGIKYAHKHCPGCEYDFGTWKID